MSEKRIREYEEMRGQLKEAFATASKSRNVNAGSGEYYIPFVTDRVAMAELAQSIVVLDQAIDRERQDGEKPIKLVRKEM